MEWCDTEKRFQVIQTVEDNFLWKTNRAILKLDEKKLRQFKSSANTLRNFERGKTKDGKFCIEGQQSLTH